MLIRSKSIRLCSVEDDKIGDDIEEDDKIEDDDTKEGQNEKQQQKDDQGGNDRVGEVDIRDIPWNWGVKPVPTVDELYPDESPEDNARWYQELHQPRPRTPPRPRKSIGKTKSIHVSNISTEDDEMFCQLCFYEGEPVSVVRSHHNLDVTCPTMTDKEKETMYGPNWIAKMYGYPD